MDTPNVVDRFQSKLSERLLDGAVASLFVLPVLWPTLIPYVFDRVTVSPVALGNDWLGFHATLRTFMIAYFALPLFVVAGLLLRLTAFRLFGLILVLTVICHFAGNAEVNTNLRWALFSAVCLLALCLVVVSIKGWRSKLAAVLECHPPATRLRLDRFPVDWIAPILLVCGAMLGLAFLWRPTPGDLKRVFEDYHAAVDRSNADASSAKSLRSVMALDAELWAAGIESVQNATVARQGDVARLKMDSVVVHLWSVVEQMRGEAARVGCVRGYASKDSVLRAFAGASSACARIPHPMMADSAIDLDIVDSRASHDFALRLITPLIPIDWRQRWPPNTSKSASDSVLHDLRLSDVAVALAAEATDSASSFARQDWAVQFNEYRILGAWIVLGGLLGILPLWWLPRLCARERRPTLAFGAMLLGILLVPLAREIPAGEVDVHRPSQSFTLSQWFLPSAIRNEHPSDEPGSPPNHGAALPQPNNEGSEPPGPGNKVFSSTDTVILLSPQELQSFVGLNRDTVIKHVVYVHDVDKRSLAALDTEALKILCQVNKDVPCPR